MAGLQTFLAYLSLVLQLRWTVRVAADAPSTVTIGGIFTDRNTMEEDALRFAAKFINTRRDILPDTTLTVVTNYTEVFQTFQCMQSACYLAEQGAAVIVGPRSSTSVKTVNNVCSGLHIPHIAPVATDPLLGNQRMYPYLLRMSSPDTEQSRALIALVKHFGWTRMCILTSLNDYGMNGVVEFQSVAASYNWDVVSVQQFQVNSDPSKIDVRLQLQKIKGTGTAAITSYWKRAVIPTESSRDLHGECTRAVQNGEFLGPHRDARIHISSLVVQQQNSAWSMVSFMEKGYTKRPEKYIKRTSAATRRHM
ncbi:GRIK1 [Branchiostoma lanceolatum]|uniref:GRIK1 protein n=1 Tax=Branchiostoma lanceolatum TaxID=7740 RepID=A0A8K0EJZ2_BRALA|nr:GRIK1 [Branchiostoma lanceolatum]